MKDRVNHILDRESDGSDGLRFKEGTTVPADGSEGYAKGCVFIKMDGGVGSTYYVNEGNNTSCDFNAK